MAPQPVKVPSEVRDLVAARAAARAAGDYARADVLRDEIRAAGFVVRDTPEGAVLELAPAFEAFDPAAVASILDQPPDLSFSFHLLHEGFPEDIERFLTGLSSHVEPSGVEVVVVDDASSDAETVERITGAHAFARALHLDRPVGWAAARNAGVRTSRGAIVVLVDPSVEPTGDVLDPLSEAFSDREVGLAGPFGLDTDDMREFCPTEGPDAHAIEGYFLAVRREALAEGLLREEFTWYRNADLDLSFQIRASGWRARVVGVPLAKHTHRGWAALGEDERDRRSRRNHALFLRRWGDRTDLLRRG